MDRQASRPSRIPDFETWEEEAAFWDSHDTTEFEDEWKPVEVEVVLPLRHGLTVPFESKDFHRLLAEAKRRNLKPSALARQWVLDALDRSDAAPVEESAGSVPAD